MLYQKLEYKIRVRLNEIEQSDIKLNYINFIKIIDKFNIRTERVRCYEFLSLTFRALRNVTATLTLGDAEHLREHAIPMAHAEAAWYRAHVTAAAVVVATLLRAGAFQVVATSGSTLHHRR